MALMMFKDKACDNDGNPYKNQRQSKEQSAWLTNV